MDNVTRVLAILRLTIILVVLATICTLFSGCALFSKEIDRAAKGAGKAVKFYCENMPDQSLREDFRKKVNYNASPHAIKVTCEGDETPPLITTGQPE